MECDRHIFFSFLTIFCPFNLLATQKIKILKTWKKIPGNIIIPHKYTINDSHMMYDSCDIKCKRQKFLSFWAIFCPFTSPNSPKNQNEKKKKKKKHLEISSFYNSVHNFWVVKEVKRQKMVQNEKKLCLLCFISQETYIIRFSSMVHM